MILHTANKLPGDLDGDRAAVAVVHDRWAWRWGNAVQMDSQE
jgi:hypothetical protein